MLDSADAQTQTGENQQKLLIVQLLADNLIPVHNLIP